MRRLMNSNKWLVLGFSIVGLIVVFGLYIFLIDNNGASQDLGDPHSVAVADVQNAQAIEIEDSESVRTATTNANLDSDTVNVVDRDRLLEICDIANWADKIEYWQLFVTPPSNFISIECEIAFDSYVQFHGLAQDGIFQLLSLKTPMSYQRIFEDPNGDYELVLDALSRAECRFEYEATVRWDLKEECHAQAFANHMQFLKLCKSDESFSTYKLIEGLDNVKAIKSAKENPQNSHIILDTEEMANNVWITYLENRWVYRRCSKYQADEKLFALAKNPTTQEQNRLYDLARTLGEDERWEKDTMGSVFNLLRSMSARFGDEWAMITYTPPTSVRNEWLSTMHKYHSWDKQWKAFVLHKQFGLPRFKQGIELVLALQDSDIAINWNWFVKYLCTRDTTQSDNTLNCQQMLMQLYDEVEAVDDRRLNVLANIERVALELKVYAP